MSTNVATKSHCSPRELRILIAYGLLLALASLGITGYRVFIHNQALQFPLVYLINDPTLFPDDPFARTLPHYVSLMWWPVAWLARIVPLEHVLVALFIAERAFLMWTAAYLALTVAPGCRLAATSGMAWFALSPQPILGGGTLITSYPEQTGLAIPFITLAMALFLRGRPYAWAISLGMAFNLNCTYALFALLYFTFAFAILPPARGLWNAWAGAVIVFVIVSLPAAALSAIAVSGSSGDSELWMAAAMFRLPHHLFPDTWPVLRFVKFASLIVLCVAIASRTRPALPRFYTTTVAWTCAAVCWMGLAYAATAMRSPLLLVSHPARGTDIYYVFAGVAVMAACCLWIAESPGDRPIATVGLLALFALWHTRHIALEYAIVVLAVIVWYSSSRAAQRWADPSKLAAGLVSAVVLLASATAIVRSGNGVPICRKPSPDTMRMAAWAQTQTSHSAVFLVNPNMGAFRALAQRSAFVTWKDGSAILWHRSYAAEWVERMEALGCRITGRVPPGVRVTEELNAVYSGLDDEAVVTLSRRYPIHYWVVPSDRESAFPTVFRSGSVKVLDIPD